MPYCEIITNVSLNHEAVEALSLELSGLVSRLLSKPESYVMACVLPAQALVFAGSSDPAAHVRLDSIGLPESACPELSAKLCEFVEQRVGAPASRTYVDFRDLERTRFGWSGKTFG